MQAPLRRLADHSRPALLPLACVAVLLSRAAFLPPTLEDIDSVNFALALERFDPALHRPHPPGYPVYVAAAKLVHALVGDPPRALGLLSALAQAALVVPLFALLRQLCATGVPAAWATLLTLACPILWFNGARPMSDSLGLLFVVSTQALLVRSLEAPRALGAASLLAGISLGVRLQSGLLTLPLWLWTLRRSGSWLRPVLAFSAGAVAWVIPLLIAAGGAAEYLRAFTATMGDAAASEPLVAGLTLNRTARAFVHVVVAPWCSRPLGFLVAALAALGFVVVAKHRPAVLRVAALAFVPYLVVHALFQHVESVRYSLPYVPWLAWLAVEAIGWLAARLPRPVLAEAAACGGLVAAASALTIPALSQYHRAPSPPYAALREVEARAVPPGAFVLAGHYAFSRYFDLRPAGLSVLRPPAGRALRGLTEHFRTGDSRPVLFLADPRRTDLETLSRTARRRLGQWEWAPRLRPFLSGERPGAAALVLIRPPRFFAGTGWLLSLESGRIEDLPSLPLRVAYLQPMSRPSFLLMAGVPTGDTEGCSLDITIPGLLAEHAACQGPLLGGYLLPPGPESSGYLTLSAATRRGGRSQGMPFALQGLDYAPRDEPGFVLGDGWFYPEVDDDLRSFRWAAPRACSLVHVPRGGARLVIEGTAPLEYLGPDLGIGIDEDGETRATARLAARPFRLEADLEGGDRTFREVCLSAERSFVPDEIQKNGDHRTLSLRVYGLRLEGHSREE